MTTQAVTRTWMKVVGAVEKAAPSKSRRRRVKFATGDIFLLPIDTDRNGVGQVVDRNEVLPFLAIYDYVAPKDVAVDLEAAIAAPVLFIGQSMTSRFDLGVWTIIGNLPVPPSTPFPAFKSHRPREGGYFVVDHHQVRRRRASVSEIALLPNVWSRSPTGYEKALKAHFGVIPREESFAMLVPNNETSELTMFDS